MMESGRVCTAKISPNKKNKKRRRSGARAHTHTQTGFPLAPPVILLGGVAEFVFNSK